MVGRELRTGRELRLWRDELLALSRPPFDIGPDALFLAFYASAELGCFFALGWPMPARILDLYVEFKARQNGSTEGGGRGLLNALHHFGLPRIGAEEKTEMRDLVMYQNAWTEAEKLAILDYCAGDTEALGCLLPALLPFILRYGDQSLGAALFRGRFMAAVARMEWAGVPIDVPLLEDIRAHWGWFKERMIAEVNPLYGVYDGTIFKNRRFGAYLRRQGIPWPKTGTGLYETSTELLRDMSRTYPQLGPLYDLRVSQSELKLNDLAVGDDGRNRTLLSPFGSRTARNQPSNSRFIFGPAKWLRFLIKPEPGRALAYLDWRSQEIGLAAAFSQDPNLIESYLGGDVYLGFAIKAGIAPSGATKETHETVRDLCKATVLGTNYGMGPYSLTYRLGIASITARGLLHLHHLAYPRFWRWSDAQVDRALSGLELLTPFGWPLRVRSNDYNARSLMNHPMQAGGADCMRLAACMATEAGHKVAAPVHDALLLEGDAASIEEEARAVAGIMERAAEAVTGGLRIDVDYSITRYPERYFDKRGIGMFTRIIAMLHEGRAAAE